MPEPARSSDGLPIASRRGRGAAWNLRNRFESAWLEADEQKAVGQEDAAQIDNSQPDEPTVVLPDRSRTVINKVDSPDLGFRWTVNPYRGCAHGCAYS